MTHEDFSEADRRDLAERGIREEEARRQAGWLRRPPRFARLVRPCTVGDGIVRLPPGGTDRWIRLQEAAALEGRLMKFVPASGAATRMFGDLLGAPRGVDLSEVRRRAAAGDGPARGLLEFLAGAGRLAFVDELRARLAERGEDLDRLASAGPADAILDALLGPGGMGYGARPKGLIPFHRYGSEPRTPLEEHLVEAASYLADRDRVCRIHVTVSGEHLEAFERALREVEPRAGARCGVRFRVDLSVQSPATDTLALGPDGGLARGPAGRLLLRPGGHGALLENLQAAGGDIVYLRNIDNIAVESVQAASLPWRKILGGYLLELEGRVRAHLGRLEAGDATAASVEEALAFARAELREQPPAGTPVGSAEERRRAALQLLARPLRVCGVVPNTGDPGGGPFWIREEDGRERLRIVEGAEVDPADDSQRAIFAASTHFNPVDLACAVRDARGRPYRLEAWADPDAVLLARKTEGGSELTALERPGLWNGAMARWHTVFVEVPRETFSPVKTVTDLLAREHQPDEGA